MLKYATVALCAVALIACQKQEGPGKSRPGAPGAQPTDMRGAKVNEVVQPAPQFVDRSLLGSELGPDGAVAKDTDKIPAGQPVYLTMVFKESPPGLQASAVWTTIDKKPVSTERKEMNGSKVATFALSNSIKPGRYKVVGYWGGNIAAERDFEITAQKGEGKKGKKG